MFSRVLLRLRVLFESPAFLSPGQGAAAAFVSPGSACHLGGDSEPELKNREDISCEDVFSLCQLEREEHLPPMLCLLRDGPSTAELHKDAFQPRSPALNSCHGE